MSKIKRLPTSFSYSSAVVPGDYVFLGLHRGFGEGFTARMTSTTGVIDDDCLLMIEGIDYK